MKNFPQFSDIEFKNSFKPTTYYNIYMFKISINKSTRCNSPRRFPPRIFVDHIGVTTSLFRAHERMCNSCPGWNHLPQAIQKTPCFLAFEVHKFQSCSIYPERLTYPRPSSNIFMFRNSDSFGGVGGGLGYAKQGYVGVLLE